MIDSSAMVFCCFFRSARVWRAKLILFFEVRKKKCKFLGNLHFFGWWFVVCGLLFYSCALGVEEFISTLDEELAVADDLVGIW